MRICVSGREYGLISVMGKYPGEKLISVDKERVLNQIDQRRINLAEVAYLDLELATKVVKELEISFCLICPQLRRVDC